jgi:glutathione S-transferase
MLTLHHHPASVASAKVRIVLEEKQIPCNSRVVDLFRGEHLAPDYLALNPAGVVPTLVTEDGRIIRESLVICEYLEEAFPGPSLVPADFVARARMRVWCKDVETFMSVACAGLVFPARDRYEVAKLTPAERDSYYARHPNAKLAERKRIWAERGFAAPEARSAVLTYHKFLQKMEMQLAKARWLAGEAYSLADAETVPYVALLEMLGFERWWKDRLPHVDEWYARVGQRPAVRKAVVEAVPADLRSEMRARAATLWPEVDAILATAEPFNGRSPWAMRAEAL